MVGLYKRRMEQAGLQALFAESQDEETLLGIIKAVKAGKLDDSHQGDYERIAGNLVGAGADALLIACTEFSVIGPPVGAAGPVVDALGVLVEATIATARGEP